MAITPYLLYEDVDRALTFLSKAFGFRKCGAQMRGADGGRAPWFDSLWKLRYTAEL